MEKELLLRNTQRFFSSKIMKSTNPSTGLVDVPWTMLTSLAQLAPRSARQHLVWSTVERRQIHSLLRHSIVLQMYGYDSQSRQIIAFWTRLYITTEHPALHATLNHESTNHRVPHTTQITKNRRVLNTILNHDKSSRSGYDSKSRQIVAFWIRSW